MTPLSMSAFEVAAAANTGDLKILFDQFKLLFPAGIPRSFADLSDEQKTWFARAGGDAVMFLTGHVSGLRKVVPNREVQDRIFAEVSESLQQKKDIAVVDVRSDLYQLISTKRERYALAEVKAYLHAHPTQEKVILIYGRIHDFKRHDDLIPRECIDVM